MNKNNFILFAQIASITKFKEVLEHMLLFTEKTNFTFDKTYQHKYITVKLLNDDETVLSIIKLNNNSLMEFICPNKLTLGINIKQLYRFIKPYSVSNELTISMKNNEQDYITINITGFDEQFQFQMNLLKLDNLKINIPKTIEVDSIITMHANDFKNLLNEINILAKFKTIDIKCKPNEIMFHCNNITNYETFNETIDTTINYVVGSSKTTTINSSYSFGSVKSKKTLNIGYVTNININNVELSHITVNFNNLHKYSNMSSISIKDAMIFIKKDYPLVIKYEGVAATVLICFIGINQNENVNEIANEIVI